MKKMLNKDMLTISQFSKLSDTSRKLLIYYDNNGIFHPEFTDENGYRYYSFDQLRYYFRICVFKELGMPLKEISNYLQNYSPEKEVDILKQQDDILAKKIRELTSSRDMLHSRLERLKDGINAPLLSIFTFTNEEKPLYISKSLNGVTRENITFEQVDTFYRTCIADEVSPGYSESYLWDSQSLLAEQFDSVSHLAFFVHDKQYANARMPKGDYIGIYTPLSQRQKALEKLRKYILEKKN